MTSLNDEERAELEKEIIESLLPALREQGAEGDVEIFEYDEDSITFIDEANRLYFYKKGPENYGKPRDIYYH